MLGVHIGIRKILLYGVFVLRFERFCRICKFYGLLFSCYISGFGVCVLWALYLLLLLCRVYSLLYMLVLVYLYKHLLFVSWGLWLFSFMVMVWVVWLSGGVWFLSFAYIMFVWFVDSGVLVYEFGLQVFARVLVCRVCV